MYTVCLVLQGHSCAAAQQVPGILTKDDCAVHVSIQMQSRPTALQLHTIYTAEQDSASSCSSVLHCSQVQKPQHQGRSIADADASVQIAGLDALPPQTALEQGSDTAAVPEVDESLCTICYDNEASCVFMECGHGGYCWRCAHVLFARPPSECPVCRQPIQQVLELEDRCCQVGRPVRVKRLDTTVSSQTHSGPAAWFKKREHDNGSV